MFSLSLQQSLKECHSIAHNGHGALTKYDILSMVIDPRMRLCEELNGPHMLDPRNQQLSSFVRDEETPLQCDRMDNPLPTTRSWLG